MPVTATLEDNDAGALRSTWGHSCLACRSWVSTIGRRSSSISCGLSSTSQDTSSTLSGAMSKPQSPQPGPFVSILLRREPVRETMNDRAGAALDDGRHHGPQGSDLA